MYVPVEVRPSSIYGKGLFPVEDVKRGTIVCSFTTDAKVVTERGYVEAIEKNQYLFVRTGTRYVGKYFTYTEEPDADLNFFNHSFEPNLLCHCGVVIALCDIPAGEEFTVDYRTLIDDTDIGERRVHDHHAPRQTPERQPAPLAWRLPGSEPGRARARAAEWRGVFRRLL